VKICSDILRTIEEEGGEARPTRIMYRANLSYTRLKAYLSELKEMGLIKEEVSGEHTVYRLTRKGVYFLIELRRIEEFLAAFGFAL